MSRTTPNKHPNVNLQNVNLRGDEPQLAEFCSVQVRGLPSFPKPTDFCGLRATYAAHNNRSCLCQSHAMHRRTKAHKRIAPDLPLPTKNRK